ncbi:MAG: DUF6056 family protein [Lachnospiraceae bacterium]|nr:DUF6056 family protein [Lachnospiraceae bacterium]
MKLDTSSQDIEKFVNKLFTCKYATHLPLLLVILCQIPTMIFGNNKLTDDVAMFTKPFKEGSTLDFLKYRYFHWSSRIIIEPFTIFFCNHSDIFWKITHLLMFILMFYLLVYLFTAGKLEDKWMVALGMQLFSVSHLYEMGWVTVTTTYLYPLILVLFSWIPIKNMLSQKKTPFYLYILSIPSFIIGTNMELILIMVIMSYLSISIYLFLKKQKPNAYYIVYGVLIILALIFFLTCPGLNERYNIIQNMTEQFESYNLVDKAFHGFLDTMIYYIANCNFQYLFLFLIIIYILMFFKTGNRLERVSLIFTLVYSIFLTIGHFFKLAEEVVEKAILPPFFNFFFNEAAYKTSGLSIWGFSLEIIFYLLLASILLYFPLFKPLKNATPKQSKNIWITLILVISILDRIALGFSPNLDLISARLAIISSFGIIVFLVLLINNYECDKRKVITGFSIMAMVSIILNAFVANYNIF